MNKWTKSRDIHNCRAALMGVQAREGVSGFDGEARLAGLLRIRRGENTLGPRVVNSEDIAVRTPVVTQAELALATSVAERRPEAIVSPFTCSRVIHFTRLPSKSDMDSLGFTWIHLARALFSHLEYDSAPARIQPGPRNRSGGGSWSSPSQSTKRAELPLWRNTPSSIPTLNNRLTTSPC